MFGKPKSPEKILKQVEIYLADINVPNNVALQTLKKGIKSFPDSKELKTKLKKLEESADVSITQSSPKTLYGILIILICLMGIGLLYSYFTDAANTLALFLGISFILGSLVIFNQYRKEK